LNTGVDMLLEQGVTAGVGHIRLKAVVERAGLTTGAAYRLWDDQEHFHRDLAAAAVVWRSEAPLTSIITAIRGIVDAGGDVTEVIRVGARSHVESLTRPAAHGADGEPGPPYFVTSVALRSAAASDPVLRKTSLDRHREMVASYADLYRALMNVYGLRPKPPFTVDHIATVFAALGEGFALQANVGEDHPVVTGSGATVKVIDAEEGDATEDDESWTLLGRAFLALVDAWTEPDPDNPGRPADRSLTYPSPVTDGTA
jgi:AcrR family transcriptional regulator